MKHLCYILHPTTESDEGHEMRRSEVDENAVKHDGFSHVRTRSVCLGKAIFSSKDVEFYFFRWVLSFTRRSESRWRWLFFLCKILLINARHGAAHNMCQCGWWSPEFVLGQTCDYSFLLMGNITHVIMCRVGFKRQKHDVSCWRSRKRYQN